MNSARIQHNIASMNAYRNYTTNNSLLSKNLEKLSSGYKINRAGDDAAGLAISEKMRIQITGLDTATQNAKDGISLVQTAEGALQEVHDMLNRMYKLAEQSSNGTYDDSVDRAQLQKEVDKLSKEIDRIAASTNFNGKNLLDGSLAGAGATSTKTAGTAAVAAVAGTWAANSGNPTAGSVTDSNSLVTDMSFAFDGSADDAAKEAFNTALTDSGVTITVAYTAAAESSSGAGDGAVTLGTISGTITGYTIEASGVVKDASNNTIGTITFTKSDTNGATAISSAVNATATLTGSGATSGGSAAVAATAATNALDFTDKTGANMIGGTMTLDGVTYEFVENVGDADAANTEVVLSQSSDASAIAAAIAGAGGTHSTGTVAASGAVLTWTSSTPGAGTAVDATFEGGKGLNLQIGDTADSYNRMDVTINDVHVAALGIGSINIGNEAGAVNAMALIKAATNQISGVRGELGATQNRLEHTINNLGVMKENIQDAESALRDTDVAEEMMKFTKNSIMNQAAQAMLAQANQLPQGVLQLLQ